MNNFAIFIISHERADNVVTYRTLKRCGYTGKVYIICDTGDTQLNKYRDLYKDSVIVFSKQDIESKIDMCDNFGGYGASVFVRNACFDIAKNLGLDYFLVLDDDYVRFEIRYVKNKKLCTELITNLDEVCKIYIDYLIGSNLDCVAFAQGGDLIGGTNSALWKNCVKRKIMNSFFCRVDKRINFSGRMNEDVNAYVSEGKLGKVFLTIRDIDIVQVPTQQQEGGLSELYVDSGTYVKSFYTVLMEPSCVKIYEIGPAHKRFHHTIDWESAVPKIISSKFRR